MIKNKTTRKLCLPGGDCSKLDGRALGHPHMKEPTRNHLDTSFTEQSRELGQRQGRLGAENVEENHGEIQGGFAAGHPAEIGPKSVILETTGPLDRKQVDPWQGEHEPDSERKIRIDFKRRDLARPGEFPVDDLGRTHDAVHVLQKVIRDEQNDRECGVDRRESCERVVHGTSFGEFLRSSNEEKISELLFRKRSSQSQRRIRPYNK